MALYIGKSKSRQSSDAISIPLSLLSWVREHGFADGDALKWLREACYYSAPITHPEGNRRYGDVLLTITRNRLESLSLLEPDCPECNDSGVFTVYENCAGCPGNCDMELCSQSVVREWPCQSCALDKRGSKAHTRETNQRGLTRRADRDENPRRKRTRWNA